VRLISAALDLAKVRTASPAALSSYLGVAQWYDLLQRLKLATFEQVYAFAANARDRNRTPVPDAVVQELFLDLVMNAFISVDMRKPHLPFVGATDASSSYGHGAAVAPLSPAQVEALARFSTIDGDYVVLEGARPQACQLSRKLGVPRDVGLQMSDFEVVLSLRVDRPKHINLEEAEALIRFVKWVLRSPARFGHRVVILLDSKVVIGAAAKGRSPSVPLNRILRRLAALTFVGGLVLHLVYITSHQNPSDPPSRGGPATWPSSLRKNTRHGKLGCVRRERRRELHSARERPSKVAAYMTRFSASLKRLRETDMWSDSDTTSSASSSQ
jgi:hypothetical protein